MESETVPKDYSAQLCDYEVRVCSTTIKWPAYHLALHVIREHPTELWERGYPSTEPFASQTAYLNRVGRMCNIVEELETFKTKCADVKPKLLQPVTQERTEVHEIYKEGTELLNRAIQLGEEQTTLDHTLPTEPDLLGSKYWEVSRFRYSLQAIQDAARQFPEKEQFKRMFNPLDVPILDILAVETEKDYAFGFQTVTVSSANLNPNPREPGCSLSSLRISRTTVLL